MKVKIAACGILILLGLMSAAPFYGKDNPHIESIRKIYQDVNRHIKEGVLVGSVYEYNSAKGFLPGWGLLWYTITMYRYNEPLWDNVKSDEGPVPRNWIATVNYVRGERGSPLSQYEFLFDSNNNLIFFCQTMPKSSERRYYFFGGKIIRIINGGKTRDASFDEYDADFGKNILEAAEGIKKCAMPVLFLW